MARKTATITIDAEGRDYGKAFVLREMPAAQAEKWAIRAFHGLSQAGVDIPLDIQGAGLAGWAVLGLSSVLSMAYRDLEPLLDEMFECVQCLPDPSRPAVVRPLIDDDIEEVATRIFLRREVFELHTGFFAHAARLKSEAATAPTGTPIMPTSPE